MTRLPRKVLTQPTALHKLEEPLPPARSVALSSSRDRTAFSHGCGPPRLRSGYRWGRRLRKRTPAGEGGDGAPGRRGLDGGSCLCAAAARADYASQPAPLPPRAPAPRPPAGSRLLIAALTRPRRHPCSWPRYLGADGLTAGADGLTARPAGPGMGAPTGERAGSGWGPAGASRCLQPPPAARGWLSALGPWRMLRGVRPWVSPAASCLPGPAGCAGLRRRQCCEGGAGGGRPWGVDPTPCTAAPLPLQPAGPR